MIKQNKIFRIFLSFVLMILLYQTGNAQLTLSEPLTGSHEYVDPEQIRLIPGFGYGATPTEGFVGKIGEYSSHKIKYGQIVGAPLCEGGIVGAIPGIAGVGPSGSATYSVPVEVPAGIKGMQPNLSINYNSHGGNGMLGLGMSLGGLSAIVRVPDNPYYDNGSYHAVDFTQSDKLSLDGQRLLVTSAYYGSTNSTYTTENDPSTKITARGSGLSASGTYFEVETKSGITMYYGTTDDSKLVLSNQTNPFLWYIKRMEDANGNYMEYNYTTIDGEKLIDYIEYTGNGSQAPFYKIKFNYMDRVDPSFAWVNGAKLEQKQLLEYIEILYNNTMLKKYSFAYEYDIVARMVGVSLQNAEGEYLNPTVLAWEEKVGTATTQTTIDAVNGVAGDFNADGLSDFLAVTEEGGRKYERLYLNDNGTLTNSGWSQEITFEHSLFENVLDFNGDGKMDILDIDIVTQPIGSSNLYIKRAVIGLSTGNAINYLYGPVIHFYDPYFPKWDFNLKSTIGDFDGDGLDDVFLVYEDNSAYLLSYKNSQIETISLTSVYGLYYEIGKFVVGDYNGDGLTDIGCIRADHTFKAWSVDINARELKRIDSAPINLENLQNLKPETGDFNGDGLTDLIDINRHNPDGYNIRFINVQTNTVETVSGELHIPSNEHGLSIPIGISVLGCNEIVLNFSYTIGDINLDGRADIIYTIGKGYEFYKITDNDPLTEDQINQLNSWGLEGIQISSHGAAWKAPKSLYIAFGRGNGTFVFKKVETYKGYDYSSGDDVKIMDLNGDGILDVYVKIEDTYRARAVNVRFHNYQLKTATDGLNNTVQFDYKSLNNPNEPIYSPYTNAQFPVKDFTGSLIAVEKITHSNGVSDNIVEKYSYEGGKIHMQGKGFIGFGGTRVTNPATGITNYSQNALHLTYMNYRPWTTNQYLNDENNSIIKTETHSSLLALGGKRYFYSLDYQKVEDNLNLNTTQKYYTYDNYANVETERTVTEDATILTTNIYVTRGAWCDNKIATTTTTVTRGTESKPRTKKYLWDDKGNLTKETVDPGDANELFTDYSNYDDFGNPETVTVTAKNYPPRTGTFTYENGRMVKTSTNSLNQTTTYTNNLDWGNIGSVTDFKTRTTTYLYDGWGRQTGISYPDNINVTTATLWAKGSGPSGAVYYNHKETSGSAPGRVWFDARGKELRAETTGFNGQVYVDTEYDVKGRVHSVSEPYYAGGTKKDIINGYDDYSRVITKTLPTSEVITTSYEPNQITITGPNTNITKVTNSLGEVVSTTDNNGNESVSYEYYPDGLLKSSTPSTGVAVTMNYNTQGNRTELIDPDAGTITSEYNGFGELIWQEDNKGNRTTNYYDTHGRLDYIERNNASTIDYVYDADSRLSGISDGVHTIGYQYDDFDRIKKTTENIDSRDFVFEVVLDEYGRVEDEIFPSGYTITNVYNDAGIRTDIIDENNVSIWKADIVNALGQFEQVTKGNGVSTVYGYDAHHRPTSITAGSIIDFTYEFDPVKGNLNYRKDELNNVREDFFYDELNRLKGVKLEGQTDNYLDIVYDANGNIKSKTDAASTYVYEATQPHAVSTLEGFKNIPDENPQNIIYNHFNKISNITEGGYEMNFTYGVDEYRKKTELYNASVLSKTKYLFGDYEVELDAANNERKIHYIAGGDGLAAIYIIEPGSTTGDLYYAYADHLGSLVALEDKNKLVHRQSFDPWGRRRDVDDWGYNSPGEINIVDIGYTGHEHLNEFGIINMTGRLYDPVLGRMFSPDPFVQAPGYAQNYNRYSYAWNNPLVYSDPSGEFIEWIVAGAIILGKFIHDGIKNDWNWSEATYTVGVGGSTSGFNSYGAGVSWNGQNGFYVGGSPGGGLGIGYNPSSPSSITPFASYGPDNVSQIVSRQITNATSGIYSNITEEWVYDDFYFPNEMINMSAFLLTLRQTENSGNEPLGYNSLYGGGTFTDRSYTEAPEDYANHPGIKIKKWGQTSTAAGAYQFLKGSWKYLSDKYELSDFSPTSQDRAAIALINENRALNYVFTGDIDRSVQKLNGIWTSLGILPIETTQTLYISNRIDVINFINFINLRRRK